MPALTSLRLGALETLADQLRYAPTRTILRQLEAIERFAGEIDVDSLYPEDFVVYRVTGYRPPIDEPTMILGGALLGDLSALAERISSGGRLTLEEHAGGTLSLDELCARWGVTRKTIERRRRTGLVGRRFRRADGKEVLRFSHQTVEAYESANAARVEHARDFRRLDGPTTDRLLARAREARGAHDSPTALARALADEFGISHETVRRILAEAGELSRGTLDGRTRTEIARADALGEPVRSIAERYERTPASIRRIAREARIACLPDPHELPLRLSTHLDDVVACPPEAIALHVSSFAIGARRDGPTPAERERALARAYHACVRSASEVRASPRITSRQLDEATTLMRRACWCKRALVRSSRRLVLSAIEERAGVPFERLPAKIARRAHRAGFDALARTVDRFDPTRGGRLAAPGSLVIGRALSRVDLRVETGMDPAPPDAKLDDWSTALIDRQPLVLPPEIIASIPSLESDEIRSLLEERFGTRTGRPMTLAELAHEHSTSRQAMVRRVRRALRTCSETGMTDNRRI